MEIAKPIIAVLDADRPISLLDIGEGLAPVAFSQEIDCIGYTTCAAVDGGGLLRRSPHVRKGGRVRRHLITIASPHDLGSRRNWHLLPFLP